MTIDIILASNSPRRQQFLNEWGLPFRVQTFNVEENYPPHLQGAAIPRHIAEQKAKPFKAQMEPHQLVITADTIVWHENNCLGKPTSEEEAIKMLGALSGKTHEVITAVGLLQKEKWEVFHETTQVTFRTLSTKEIVHYVQTYQPLDKAGAYGIQEWIGTIGITTIQGSYTNVVGLPVAQLVRRIEHLVEW